MARREDDPLGRQLRLHAEAMLEILRLPPRFSLADLHDRVERRRGRRIRLIPRPAFARHALWVTGVETDAVLFDRSASPLRQIQVIGHEFGHMVFDDDPTPVSTAELAALLAVAPEPRLVRAAGRRIGYDALLERRAEVFAAVVAERVRCWAGAPRPRGARHDAPVVHAGRTPVRTTPSVVAAALR